MQVVVFGAHDAPRERLALSYTSRRDHLGAECLPLHPRWQRASGERALQGASSGTALGNVCFTLRSRASHQQRRDQRPAPLQASVAQTHRFLAANAKTNLTPDG